MSSDETSNLTPAECHAVAEQWLSRLGDALEAGDATGAAASFADECHWRDLLAFTWHFHVSSGRPAIENALAETLAATKPSNFRLRESASPRLVNRGGVLVVEMLFEFDSSIGNCLGTARIVDFDQTQPRAWVMMTQLDSVDAFVRESDQRKMDNQAFLRVFGGDNWSDQRREASTYEDRDPQVLVVGGGQCGLGMAARLNRLGVDTLVIDKWPRVGDNWRKRYHSLLLHNQTWVNHLPYIPFPESFPVYLPKDKLANWFEFYADAMEINYWGAIDFQGASFDPEEHRWTAKLRRADGTEREVHPEHIVMATGISGGPVMPDIPGLDDFDGEVTFAAKYDRGEPYAGKRVVVIGVGTSGHDVAQDMHCAGADVTMVQRGSITVTNLESSQVLFSIYNEGLSTDDADLLVASSPYPVLVQSYKKAMEWLSDLDADFIEALNARGMKTDYGEDGTGFQMKYLERGGGYYINVGCSELIIEGEIALRQYDEIDRIVPNGIQMKDGSLLPADVLVLATGFKLLPDFVRTLLGDSVADKLGQVWGFDEGGELANMFKRTPQENLWFHAGSLAQSRVYSKFLALQIKARLEGLLDASVPTTPGDTGAKFLEASTR
jgi:cation diffusion facilitator CzcD-associated flavoprotein CzcO